METVKPWKAEYAKSSRSSCKSCKLPIEKDRFRLGKMVAATQFDGYMPMWNHATCIFKRANQIKSIDDVEGADLLRWEDQQMLRKYVEGSSVTPAASTSIVEGKCAIEVSKTSRATCKQCNEKILKGTIRVSMQPEGQGPRGLSWFHVKCFSEMSSTLVLEKLSGWGDLEVQDKELVLGIVKGKGMKPGYVDDKVETPQKVPQRSNKRQKKIVEQESLSAKDGNVSTGKMIHGDEDPMDLDKTKDSLDSQLEEQSKALWSIKDELKKHVTVGELREMLEVNEQDSQGSEYDLRERCADGMMFGALEKCPLCSGSLCYSGGQYRCHGYLSAWSKCTYSSVEVVRSKKKWKIPDQSSNSYLCNWAISQSVKKPLRIIPSSSSRSSVARKSSNLSVVASGEGFESLKLVIIGVSEECLAGWKKKLESFGVAIHPKIKKETNCLVVGGEVNNSDAEVRKARRMKLPIVRESYIADCMNRQKKLPFELYKVEPIKETPSTGTITVKVKGRSAVHEASGLQETCHILEDGKTIYNTTLNMSDLSTGINSYYVLQVIEEDKGSDCYVFRKWGRVGNEKIGGSKLEEMSRSCAIEEFKRLFLEKTGNPWVAWVEKKNFEKQPGRFFPLEIDYGVKQTSRKRDLRNEKSLLPLPLANLMKMLFNIETYRAAMMEFEINLSEMPLGKLSKINIQKGFEALTEVQDLLNNCEKQSSAILESMIIDASNRFFTLIPSVHPHVIRNEVDLKAKVKMLEALQDIEIASRLVGFDCDNDDSLDEKYMKLQCNIVPLAHDSEDYKLVKNYLLNTHAPTHKDWSLELEEVFSLDRKGELDHYTRYKDKLHNKMLLWHGSRLTNFVGILSQGLRIAPPEAPVTGYMFGKGLYFADLVSKSAQYCYVDKKDPVGLLLLSEVALGDMHELKKASYMDKPPKGKHSTKGLGKTVPLEADFVKWREEVVVPCGKPVPSSIRASELLYNEYIVYNRDQVKMQFLLKVRFHHKR